MIISHPFHKEKFDFYSPALVYHAATRPVLILIAFFCSCLNNSVFPQQHSIDSINSVIAHATHDTARAAAYVALTEIYYVTNKDTVLPVCKMAFAIIDRNLAGANPKERKSYLLTRANGVNNIGAIYYARGRVKEALEQYEIALKLYEEVGDRLGVATSLNNFGGIYHGMGELTKAMGFYEKSLTIQEELKNQDGIARELSNMGTIASVQGQIKLSLDYDAKALKIQEKINDLPGIAVSLNNIGSLYNNLKQYKEALNCYERAMNIQQKLGDKTGISRSMNNMGVCYRNLGQSDKALEFFQKSLVIREEIKDKFGITYSLTNIGGIYNLTWRLEDALDFYNRALVVQRSIQDKQGISRSLNNIGEVYFKQHKYPLAKSILDQSLVLANELGYPDLIGTAEGLYSKVDSALGNIPGAFTHYKRYILFRDSIASVDARKSAIKQQVEYDYDKKTAVMKAEQEKEKLIVEERVRKQTVLLWSVAGGLLLVLIIAGIIFRSLKITSRQKKIIEEKNLIVEEKQKEILDSINYAKRLQEAILPPVSSLGEFFSENFVFYRPKDIVAGDFYWWVDAGDWVFIAAADCTGHGVPGALVSVVCSNALNRAIKEFGLRNTGKILDKVTDLVLETFGNNDSDVKDGMDISLLSFSKNRKQVQWSGANNPLWYFENGSLIKIPPDKQPVGKYDTRKSFTTRDLDGGPGRVYYLFTDGLPDQFGGAKGKKFMYSRFEESLTSMNKESLPKQLQMLEQVLNDWKGRLEQVDDITIIGIKG
jgi:tetratricopeptide (TPR) repeat protein